LPRNLASFSRAGKDRLRSVSLFSMKKLRVAVLFGGRSGEHEVSQRSAASVVRELDRSRFEILPIGITQQGVWRALDPEWADRKLDSLPIPADALEVQLPPRPRPGERPAFLPITGEGARDLSFDVVFPVLHGSMGEDGTLQGLLDLAEVPYVGCGVLSSSVGMDKEVAKRLARDSGLPVVPFVSLGLSHWKNAEERTRVRERVERELGFPVFVKPANSGSSLGVHKVKAASELEAAVTDAFRYDLKVLVERGIAAREIEFAVLESPIEGELPQVSIAGEIVPQHEFYSYEAKYVDAAGAKLLIPAELPTALHESLRALARDAFVALECSGLARVDLFLDRQSGAIFLNEINTLPGFTSISMYPKLWGATGIGYADLLGRLVDLALLRHQRRASLLRHYEGARG
jgi:D-alanine-D-alanine ligase